MLTLAIGLCAPRALAQPAPGDDLSSVDAELRDVQAKLSELAARQQEAVERYNQIESELAELSEKAALAAVRREGALEREGRARRSFEARARAAYKRGNPAMQSVLLLLDSESIGNILAGLRALQDIAVADADEARQFRAEAEVLAAAEAELHEAEEEKAQAQAGVKQEIDAIDASIAEEQAFRKSLDDKKAQALARAEAEQRAREADTASRAKVSVPQVQVSSGSIKAVLDAAMAQLGKPYRYGASGPDSFDCSGLVMYAYAAAGVRLPHRADLQYWASGNHPTRGQLQPGDLVFFSRAGTLEGIHHNGIYVGNGLYIHAPQTGDVVKLSSVDRKDFIGGTRIAV